MILRTKPTIPNSSEFEMAPSEPRKFFKIILSSTLQEGKLKIPKKFVKEQEAELSELSETIKLCIPSCQSWSVRIERDSDNGVWLNGLDKFLEHNNIKFGYILVFNYEGNSRFGVQIFDLTALEIEYSCIDDTGDGDESSVECLGSSMEHDLYGSGKVRKWYFTRGRKQVMERVSEDNVKINQYGKKPRIYKDTTRNDFFKVTLTPSSIKKRLSRVPSNVAWLKMPHSTRVIKLVDDEDNEWAVRFINNLLSAGWGQFVQDKKLMVGDVCMFERVSDEDEVKLRVTISRSDGNKPTMYKDTTRNDDGDTSKGDLGIERIIEPEKESSSPRFFKVTMTTACVKKYILGVPSNFARLYMPHSTLFIKLVDDQNNEWAVRYIHHRYSKFLSLGWRHFVQDKRLIVGDVCIFESVFGGDEVKLRVTISRNYGKNSTMYKETTTNDGANASQSGFGNERVTEPRNESPSPNFFKAVPSAFARLHMCDMTMLLRLVDAEDNEWAVRYIRQQQQNHNFLTMGWRQFVQDKKLRVGDVCIFELVSGGDEVKLRVKISRFGKQHE